MMRVAIYRLGFGLVALCVVIQLALWPLARLGVQVPFGPWSMLLEMFGQPIPGVLRHLVPRLLAAVLYWAFVVLVVRRLWLIAKARAFVAPASLTRAPYVFLLISVSCIALFVVALGISITINAGSGVPAAMLLIPATLLLAPTIAWIESWSLVPQPRKSLVSSNL